MTSWEEDMAEANEQRASSSTSDFYKFAVGEHVMRIMTMPVKKESRFGEGYGICYPGAKYCDPVAIEAEYQEKMKAYGEDVEARRVRGATQAELKTIKKPSRANIGIKWSVWAIVRKFKDEKGRVETINELKIVDLPHGISEKLLALKQDKDMGTNFDSFPMPYDVKIIVSKKKVKGTWTPKDIEYDLNAGTVRSEVTQMETDDLEKKTPVDQIIARMQEKKREEDEGGASDDAEESSGGVEYPKDDIDPSDIPF